MNIVKENTGHTRSISEATLENFGDQTNKSQKKRQVYLKKFSLVNGYDDVKDDI